MEKTSGELGSTPIETDWHRFGWARSHQAARGYLRCGGHPEDPPVTGCDQDARDAPGGGLGTALGVGPPRRSGDPSVVARLFLRGLLHSHCGGPLTVSAVGSWWGVGRGRNRRTAERFERGDAGGVVGQGGEGADAGGRSAGRGPGLPVGSAVASGAEFPSVALWTFALLRRLARRVWWTASAATVATVRVRSTGIVSCLGAWPDGPGTTRRLTRRSASARSAGCRSRRRRLGSS